jgi:hypothetical protein
VVLVPLSSPETRLRGRGGELLPPRRPCARCGAVISAWAEASDRFCGACAPRVDDEPPRDPLLYCPKGHLRSEFEVIRVDRSRPSGFKLECSECHRERNAKRDRSKAATERKQIEAQTTGARELQRSAA